VGIRWADHATPSIRKMWALTSPTCDGRSVGMVRLWTKTMEFVFVCLYSPDDEGMHSTHVVIKSKNKKLHVS
jgi:hypothetical protein